MGTTVSHAKEVAAGVRQVATQLLDRATKRANRGNDWMAYGSYRSDAKLRDGPPRKKRKGAAREEDDNESVIEQDWGAVEIGAKSEKGEEKDEKADEKEEKKQDELEAIVQV